jgi:small subunit ribosomal protein S6
VRDYELMIVLDPNLDEEALETATNRVQSTINQRGGAVKNVESWGRRRLAYPIGRNRDGTYILLRFQAKPEATAEVERALKLMESVVRYLVVRVEEKEPAAATP